VNVIPTETASHGALVLSFAGFDEISAELQTTVLTSRYSEFAPQTKLPSWLGSGIVAKVESSALVGQRPAIVPPRRP
jgi:hypothetical protein